MTRDKFCNMLWLLIPQVIQIVVEEKHVSSLEAVNLFYNSELYSKLSIEDTKLWHFSAMTLYELFEEEQAVGSINYP